MRPEDLTINPNSPGAQQKMLMTAVGFGSPTMGYTADGKTIEQKRGAMLAKRLELLNEYLTSGSDLNFGDYIGGKGITVKMFLSELPKDHQFLEIGGLVLSDEDSKDAIEDYTEDLNALYIDQYLAHQDKMDDAHQMSCDGCKDKYNCMGCAVALMANGAQTEQELMEGVSYGSPTMGYTASGSRKEARKQKREEIKKAKAAKKEEKKKIAADKKAGKITPKQARDKKREARKQMRDKVGSGAGRAIGKVNKFNPYAVAIRAAFISIMDINLVNIAKAFSLVEAKGGENWKKLVRKWEIFGGTESGLRAAIDKGKNKKPLFQELVNKTHKHSADGDVKKEENPSKIVAGASAGLATISGALALVPEPTPTTKLMAGYTASATGVLATMAPVLNHFAKEGGVDTSNIPLPPDSAEIDAATKAALKDVDAGKGEEAGDESFLSAYKGWIVGALVVMTLGGILMATMGGSKK